MNIKISLGDVLCMCQATKSFFFEKFSKMNIDGESFISVMNDNNRNMYMKCIV